jgi:DNA-directed RNA polymerase specialized sigma24 family protein
MRTFEAKKFNEIKDIMELSIGTVHREFNNAINKIKEFLKEHNFGWDDYVRSIS